MTINRDDSNSDLITAYVTSLGQRLSEIQTLLDRFFQDVYDKSQINALDIANIQDDVKKIKSEVDAIKRALVNGQAY